MFGFDCNWIGNLKTRKQSSRLTVFPLIWANAGWPHPNVATSTAWKQNFSSLNMRTCLCQQIFRNSNNNTCRTCTSFYSNAPLLQHSCRNGSLIPITHSSPARNVNKNVKFSGLPPHRNGQWFPHFICLWWTRTNLDSLSAIFIKLQAVNGNLSIPVADGDRG